jgi:hypothetical protein
MRSMLTQSPAIAIASAALVLSAAGGATAAAVSNRAPAAVKWHNLTLINGWQPGGFSSFHLGYYLDANGVVHLRGSAKGGVISAPVFQLPGGLGIRPSHVLSMVIYTDSGPAQMQIFTNGKAMVIDENSSTATDFSSFDGVSFPKG